MTLGIQGNIVQATTETAGAVDWFYSLAMGVVEGLTEFLPVSSTGHLIVTGDAFGRNDPDFEIAIQFGAITAILVLYWRRLFASVSSLLQRPKNGNPQLQRTNLLWLIIVAAFPASMLGLLFREHIEKLFHPMVVASSLVVGGVILILLERWQAKRPGAGHAGTEMEQITVKQAFWIGVFQSLALIPGTSRSGAMIGGGMVAGLSRGAAAEFSFLVGLPVLYGACVVSLFGKSETTERVFGDPALLTEMGIASAAAFVSAMLVVGPFVRFLQRHTFVPFGIYRIAMGAILFALIASGCLSGI